MVSQRHQRGFTLIEVIVVLAILGLALSVAYANLRPQVESMRFRATSSDILNALISYRVAAVTRREQIVFEDVEGGDNGTQFGAPPFDMDLPAGWRVEGGPIVFLSSGACLGGSVTISGADGRQGQYQLSPPDCSPSPIVP